MSQGNGAELSGRPGRRLEVFRHAQARASQRGAPRRGGAVEAPMRASVTCGLAELHVRLVRLVLIPTMAYHNVLRNS